MGEEGDSVVGLVGRGCCEATEFEEVEGAVEFAARVGAEDDVAVSLAFDFFAEGEGFGWEFVAGDGEGFVQGGEVGEDDGVGVVFGLVGDGEGAAEHGG